MKSAMHTLSKRRSRAASMRRDYGAAFAMLLLSLPAAIAGCAGVHTQPNPSEADQVDQQILDVDISGAQAILTESEVRRPIDAYLPDAQTILGALSAKETRVNSCLRENNFDESFIMVSPNMQSFVVEGVRDRVIRSSLWGFFDTRNAETYGYQRPTGGAGGAVSVPALTEAAAKSCMPQTDDSDDPVSFLYEESLPEGGPRVPELDPNWTKAVEEWSACMNSAGFEYASPLAAIGDFAAEQPASDRQIATATADLQCKVETNLVGRAVALQTAYDTDYINRNAAALADLQSRVSTLLSNTGYNVTDG